MEAKGNTMKTLYRGKGDVILEEGETTDDAYIILDGEIDVTVKNVGKVATLSKNDIFGEIAMVDQRPRTATCTAKTPVTLGQVTRENYNTLLKHRPDALIPLIRVIADRMRGLADLLNDVHKIESK